MIAILYRTGGGYDEDEWRYDFLGEEGPWREELAQTGIARLPDAMAFYEDFSLFVMVDHTESPRYLMIVELPGDGNFDPVMIRMSMIHSVSFGQSHGDSLVSLVLREPLNSLLNSASPVLIQSEPGSGERELIRHFTERRWQPGDVMELPPLDGDSLWLQEIFGERVPADKNNVAPIISMDSVAVIVHEAAAMPMEVQQKLNEHFAGSNSRNFWIFQTHQDLDALAENGSFYTPLLERLKKGRLILLPLRFAGEKILPEAHRILDSLCRKYRRQRKFQEDALKKIQDYHWPGNLYELNYVLEESFVFSNGDWIEAHEVRIGKGEGVPREGEDDLRLQADLLERNLIWRAHILYNGNQVRMARALGISRGSLQYKLDKYNL